MRPSTTTLVTAWLAAAALFASACAGESVLTEPEQPHTYDRDGIRFTHPADWPLLEGVATPDGVAPSGPVVGSFDGAGNVVGLSIEVQTIDQIPPGEERNYLEAAFSRRVTEIWGDAVVHEQDWAMIGEHDARRMVVDHRARGMVLTSEVLIAARGTTSLTVQCQAPAAVFDLLADRCASILDSFTFAWPGTDSTPATTG